MYVNIMILCLKPLILKLYVAILSHFQQIVPVTVLPHKYYTALPINCFRYGLTHILLHCYTNSKKGGGVLFKYVFTKKFFFLFLK